MTLENRVVVISGAMGELGMLVARTLAERGACLALLDRNADRLATLATSLALPDSRLFTREVNLNAADAVASIAGEVQNKFNKVDALLHLVGGWTGGKSLVEAPIDDFNFMLNQHLWTSLNMIKAFVPLLVKNGWGRVVMVSSQLASHPVPERGPYAIAKSAQEALVLSLAQELSGSGVTANLLVVKTIDARREKLSAPSARNATWTTPEEIAASILYLLSEEAGTVSGARLVLYGPD
jgi:NAD(P)-dependent dehydrogenase (short-subunit alcohol dehydrogenase family)